jgi:hypothetical protein
LLITDPKKFRIGDQINEGRGNEAGHCQGMKIDLNSDEFTISSHDNITPTDHQGYHLYSLSDMTYGSPNMPCFSPVYDMAAVLCS